MGEALSMQDPGASRASACLSKPAEIWPRVPHDRRPDHLHPLIALTGFFICYTIRIWTRKNSFGSESLSEVLSGNGSRLSLVQRHSHSLRSSEAPSGESSAFGPDTKSRTCSAGFLCLFCFVSLLARPIIPRAFCLETLLRLPRSRRMRTHVHSFCHSGESISYFLSKSKGKRPHARF